MQDPLVVGFFGWEGLDQSTTAHDVDHIGYGEQLLEFRRGYDDAESVFLHQLSDERKNLCLSGNVDPLRGLVQQENFRFRHEGSGQSELLLIPAAEVAGKDFCVGWPDSECLDMLAGQLPLSSDSANSASARYGVNGQGEIRSNRQLRDNGRGAAVSGNEHDPCTVRTSDHARVESVAAYGDPPIVVAIDTCDRAQQVAVT